MSAKDRMDNKDWDIYYDREKIRVCDCGKGHIEHVTLVASHEKVPREERDDLGNKLNCRNSECPSLKCYERL